MPVALALPSQREYSEKQEQLQEAHLSRLTLALDVQKVPVQILL